MIFIDLPDNIIHNIISKIDGINIINKMTNINNLFLTCKKFSKLSSDSFIFYQVYKEKSLYWALKLKNINIPPLLKYDINFNFKKNQVLSLACKYGYIDLVTLLLDKGADINYNYIPINEAINNNHYDIVKILLDRGADIKINNYNIFRIAIINGNIDIIKLLITYGVDINKSHGLIFASKYNKFDILKLLIEDYNADKYILDNRTLLEAELNKNSEIINYLKTISN